MDSVDIHPLFPEVAMNNENVKFLLNWNHFADHLTSCMTKLMTDTTYSDVIIATADKHMIYSHQFVLENSSKYFQRLLKHIKRQKGTQLVVALPEIKYDIFKILMNYMYKGQSQVPHELLPSVIKAGQILEINGLVNLKDSENNSNCFNLVKCNSTSEPNPRCSIPNASNPNNTFSGENNKNAVRPASTLKEKTVTKETAINTPKNNFNLEKKLPNPNENSCNIFEPSNFEKEIEITKSSLPTAKTKNTPQEKKIIQIPVKRKIGVRDNVKKTLIPSSSSTVIQECSSLKKALKRTAGCQNALPSKIKKENEIPDRESSNQMLQGYDEKITVKMELPDEIEEVVYNQLNCDFCQELYTNPTDWVRHMTEDHGDRG